MIVGDMKKKLKEMYPMSESWARRVDKMPSRQVFAIYSKNFWENGSKKPNVKKRGQIPGQMSFEDYM